MNYFRIEIDPGAFSDIMPDGGKMYQSPMLPTYEFKRDGVTYTMSDLRLLNPYGVQAFEMCLNEMIRNPGATECQIKLSDVLTEDDSNIICDIVTGFSIKAVKRGRNGWSTSGRIFGGCDEYICNDGRTLTFSFPEETSMLVAEYFKISGNKTLELSGLVVFIAKKWIEGTKDYIEKGEA